MKLYHDDMVKLKQMFGHRVKFDTAELRLYSQDISSPPAPVKLLIKSMPQAAVLPRDLDELVALVRFANDRCVPLVPRGGGSSGYGGSMPVKGGIVVDLSEMSEHCDVDGSGKTATISPGMTFLEAEARLNQRGKALRAMPTSAPVATIGGWIAQGGAGLGSLQYGWIQDLIQSVTIVLPDGDVRVLSDSELDIVTDMEGITGIIADVRLRVRDNVPLVPMLATFKDVSALQAGVAALRAEHELWAMLVHNPEFTELRQEALGTRGVPKGQFSISMAAESDKLDKSAVKATVEKAGGKMLDDTKAQAEWDLRFSLFTAKRLGPSMVPGEAVVPTKRIGESAARIRRSVKAETLLMEGVVVGDDTIWFTYSLDDERRKEFPAAFGASIAVLDAAKRVGGRTLGTGVYMSNERGRVFDENRLERVLKFKRATDPHRIMNPGKIFGTPLRIKPSWAPGPDLAFMLAPGNPVLKMMHGNSFVKYRRAETGRAAYTRGVSAALGCGAGGEFGATWAWDLIAGDLDKNIRWTTACARAFKSLAASPTGWATWAKDYVTAGRTFSAHQWAMLHGEGLAAGADLASVQGLQWSRLFIELKQHLRTQGFRPLPVQQASAENIEQHHNHYGRPHEERSAWAEGLELPAKGETLLSVDDLVAYELPGHAKAAAELLAAGGIKVAHLGADEHSSCAPLLHAGMLDEAEATIKHNIEAINKAGAKQIIVLDSYALHAMRDDYPGVAAKHGLTWDVEVRHFADVIAGLVSNKKLAVEAKIDGDIAIHDAPATTTGGLDPAATRTVVAAVGTIKELAHAGRNALDVGVSGLVPKSFPEVPARSAALLLDDAARSEAAWLVSTDPATIVALRDAAKEHPAPERGALPRIVSLTELLGAEGPLVAATSAEQAESRETEADAESAPEEATETAAVAAEARTES